MIFLLQILFYFLAFAFFGYVIYLMLYSTLRGGPYAPMGPKKIKVMMDLLKIKPGEKAVDLGSGDGRIVIELARRGAIAFGYEINPLLVLWSRYNIRKEGLQNKATIIWKDYWREDFSSFDIVTLYVLPHMMGPIKRKLKKELRSKNARIAANYFKFPDLKESKKKDTIYLYHLKS
jgi:SAM-dependent methyltransferase